MSQYTELRDWFYAQPLAVRFEAARRYAIVKHVEALERSGLTQTAAVYDAASSSKIGARTIWTWLQRVNGAPAETELFWLAPRRGQTGLKRRNPTRRIA